MSHTDQITDEYRYYLLRKRHGEDLIVKAFRGFRRAGIEPILIKGWAAARNYPEYKPRFFTDVDLAVSAADFEKSKAFVEKEGLGGIDLHSELRHFDTLEWSRIVENSEVVDLDGEGIRILSAEDHLRVLSVHWLTNGGESRKRLWDIAYAVRNRPAGFDWSRCLDVVSLTRRQWIIATIGVAHKYLGLELDGLPFAEEAVDLPKWLTRCLEKEWSRNVELRTLHSQLRYPRSLMQQIWKRIPPNPIMATVDCEGDFDHGTRAGYQIRDVFKRLIPSVQRVSATIMKRYP